MTLTGLGLDRQKTIDYVKSSKPTYMQFEKWVLDRNGGAIDPAKIKAHNDAIVGYNHSDEDAKSMRDASGVSHDYVKDAVPLNTLDDLDALHSAAHG
jgi:hypothetical protein